MNNPLEILVYSQRKDEAVFIERIASKYGVKLKLRAEAPDPKTAILAKGYSTISIITTPIAHKLMETFYGLGVRFISTRSIGYDHIDREAAKKIGMRIGNVSYAPDAVSNYTIMLILMAVRNIKHITQLSAVQDFSLQYQVMGRNLNNLTVGVAGTGRIGKRVIEHLKGFGCTILGWDKFISQTDPAVCAVSWEELCAESDIISLHMPAAEDNYHIVNARSIARMKDGVVIINTARGSLIDTTALIEGIESGKIGAAAVDVVEDESNLYYKDHRGEALPHRDLAILRSYPNVIVTPHLAFYTDQSVSDMVENSVKSCIAFLRGEENPWEVSLIK
ncbi:MAG: D-lactate dehydrogenase VanH-A [Spirochaetaceae bacterium]|jgi:D-lactate dehydrogenase|nr:D-lactate dehydrogenase VanH-A [Spirochaetaceae bacterium]